MLRKVKLLIIFLIFLYQFGEAQIETDYPTPSKSLNGLSGFISENGSTYALLQDRTTFYALKYDRTGNVVSKDVRDKEENVKHKVLSTVENQDEILIYAFYKTLSSMEGRVMTIVVDKATGKIAEIDPITFKVPDDWNLRLYRLENTIYFFLPTSLKDMVMVRLERTRKEVVFEYNKTDQVQFFERGDTWFFQLSWKRNLTHLKIEKDEVTKLGSFDLNTDQSKDIMPHYWYLPDYSKYFPLNIRSRKLYFDEDAVYYVIDGKGNEIKIYRMLYASGKIAMIQYRSNFGDKIKSTRSLRYKDYLINFYVNQEIGRLNIYKFHNHELLKSYAFRSTDREISFANSKINTGKKEITENVPAWFLKKVSRRRIGIGLNEDVDGNISIEVGGISYDYSIPWWYYGIDLIPIPVIGNDFMDTPIKVPGDIRPPSPPGGPADMDEYLSRLYNPELQDTDDENIISFRILLDHNLEAIKGNAKLVHEDYTENVETNLNPLYRYSLFKNGERFRALIYDKKEGKIVLLDL